MVIDEASQVEPVDAFGAIARGAEMVVVGDPRQLRRRPFFKAALDDDRPDPEEEPPDAIEHTRTPALRPAARRMLLWHYRSRHPSLIAVTNRAFYDDRLRDRAEPIRRHELGLTFHHVADGRYDRGGSGINRREAELVARR